MLFHKFRRFIYNFICKFESYEAFGPVFGKFFRRRRLFLRKALDSFEKSVYNIIECEISMSEKGPEIL